MNTKFFCSYRDLTGTLNNSQNVFISILGYGHVAGTYECDNEPNVYWTVHHCNS